MWSWSAYRHFLWIAFFLALGLLAACSLPTKEPDPVMPLPPSPLPQFLPDVCPKPGAVLSLDSYTSASMTTTCQTVNAICVEVNAAPLLREGDFWELEDIVYERTTIRVDGQAAECLVTSLWDGVVWHTLEDSQGNILADVGGPYYWCVHAPLPAGVHQVDVSFEKSDGEVVSFAWTFDLVDGPVPTVTPLPTPRDVDRSGHLPNYIKVVYPSPGEEVSSPPDMEEWSRVSEEMGMPMVHLIGLDKLPVCFSFNYPELLEVGTLSAYSDHLLDRVYFKVDGAVLEGCLYCSSWNLNLGEETALQCFEIPLVSGEHIATVYVDPFDADLVIYSWAFIIKEE